MIFSIGLEVVDVNSRQARDEQLQLLLSEDGDQPLGDDFIESLQESCQLLADGTFKTSQHIDSRICQEAEYS